MDKTESKHAPLSPIIAHRGASGEAPENTLASINLAIEQGAESVEIDVSISRDKIAFVHHDDTLERCTTGSGLLSEHTAEELDSLSASRLWPEIPHQPIPRLDAVLQLLCTHSIGLNLEIKPFAGLEEATVQSIAESVDQHWNNSAPLVFSSFNRVALEFASKYLSHWPRALLYESIETDWQQQMSRLACRNLHCDAACLTQEQAASVLASNFGLYCYTVNEPAQAKILLNMGVHGIFTDYPARLLAQLDA